MIGGHDELKQIVKKNSQTVFAKFDSYYHYYFIYCVVFILQNRFYDQCI